MDSHLDLAENVTLFGRDLTLRADKIRALEKRTTRQATVSLPELERGGIAMAFATVAAGFLAMDVGETFEPRSAIYHTLGCRTRRGSRGGTRRELAAFPPIIVAANFVMAHWMCA